MSRPYAVALALYLLGIAPSFQLMARRHAHYCQVMWGRNGFTFTSAVLLAFCALIWPGALSAAWVFTELPEALDD